MITPFDRMIYTAARYRSQFPVWDSLLKTVLNAPMRIQGWRGYDLRQDGRPLSPDDTSLWTNSPFLFLFTESGLLPAPGYRPVFTSALEGTTERLGLDVVRWDLTAVMAFRKSDYDFDVIPLMTQREAPQLVFPEPQLSFERAGAGWTWGLSGTGFINPTTYSPFVSALSDSRRKVLADDLDWLGSAVLHYLGGWAEMTSDAGRWKCHTPKAPRFKERAGQIKKVYEIAHAGWFEFIR